MDYSKESSQILFEDLHPADFVIKGDPEVEQSADKLRREILNFPDTKFDCGAVYYISPNGNDEADGQTKATAWKTLKNLEGKKDSFMGNTAFLFERGGTYCGFFGVCSDCYYGSYGTGEKPIIMGSFENYADESKWSRHRGDIWYINTLDDNGEPLLDIGLVAFDCGKTVGVKKKELKMLTADFDFYHDLEKSKLYLKSTAGNPGLLANELFLCSRRHGIYGYHVHDIVIENICIRFTGTHGIGLAYAHNITVRGCEIGWIGGALQDPLVRFGNGIEVWEDCTNLQIENNWIYQCYDAGITHQGTLCNQHDITLRNNLIEKCNYGIEFFVAENSPIVKNVLYEGNIIRFLGYHWGNQRFNPWAQSAVCGWHAKYRAQNFVIRNNIFEISRWYLVYIGTQSEDGIYIKFDHNSYYQRKADHAMVALWIDEETLPMKTQEEFENSVRKIDGNFAVCKLI